MKSFEKTRQKYKPSKINLLFIGEAHPSNGMFFYNEDTVLYKFTKEAFNEYLKTDTFTLEFFKDKGCYLYDIGKSHFGMTFKEKVNAIAEGIPVLAKFIQEHRPQYIISTNNSIFNAIIMANAEIGDMIPEENIFDLPTPIFGNHHFYKEELVKVLEQIDFKKLESVANLKQEEE